MKVLVRTDHEEKVANLLKTTDLGYKEIMSQVPEVRYSKIAALGKAFRPYEQRKEIQKRVLLENRRHLKRNTIEADPKKHNTTFRLSKPTKIPEKPIGDEVVTRVKKVLEDQETHNPEIQGLKSSLDYVISGEATAVSIIDKVSYALTLADRDKELSFSFEFHQK